MTPVVGVMLQSCLAAAQQEVAAGGGGSKELRAAALQTLCLVVQVVGSADALAFFVPGEALRLGQLMWCAILPRCCLQHACVLGMGGYKMRCILACASLL